MITNLRPHQIKALADVHAAQAEGHKRIVVQAPTGAGKTMLAAALIDDAQKQNKPVMFVVPLLSLINQTVAALQREGIDDIGVIQANHEMTNWDSRVQVCSIQTLLRRNKPDAQLVIIDECHVWFQHYGDWMTDPAWSNVPFIGLSATPWTKGLGAYYTKLIIASTTQTLIDEKLLSDFKVFAPYRPDLSGVRTVGGDYHEGDLSRLMNTNTLVADTVQTWIEKGQNRPTLCFAVDRIHAKALQQDFLKNGVRADYQDANTKDEERMAIKARFHSGETKVVCNIGTLTAGVDWDVRCIILARPTKSEMLFTQIIGRGLRTAAGKDHCLILDHSDTHFRLGFVTQIMHDHLDDGSAKPPKAERDIPLPKVCRGCGALIPPRSMVCPHCGYQAPAAGGRLVFADGELVELDRQRTEQKARMLVIDVLRQMGKQSIYSQFLHVARSRGYKDGWAANKYKDIFGVWPVGVAREPEAPKQTVLSWIKSEQIAWARSKNNPANQANGNGGEPNAFQRRTQEIAARNPYAGSVVSDVPPSDGWQPPADVDDYYR